MNETIQWNFMSVQNEINFIHGTSLRVFCCPRNISSIKIHLGLIMNEHYLMECCPHEFGCMDFHS
jgi:hypothetical protein